MKTTTKTAARLQPGDVVVNHYEQFGMDMGTMAKTKPTIGTDFLEVQSTKHDGEYIVVQCKRRGVGGILYGARTCRWTPSKELEVEA